MHRLFRRVRGQIASTKVCEVERMKASLLSMFQGSWQKKLLAQTLKIFPTYFNSEYIELFCQSASIKEYARYITEFKSSKQEVSDAMKLFARNEVSSIEFNPYSMRTLEAFLYWLTNECPAFKSAENDFLVEFVNLERPDQWFQQEQKKEARVFIYHHGPTNSGKSTSAIQDLKHLGPNEKGIYMAPLRLLAWEYQQKLGNCSLITGQEKQFKNSNLMSCTIEAAPLNEEYEVAVIDEIQMIGNTERGWAWTKALLALKAKRIHLCGDERALGIVSRIVQICGDVLQQRKYSRLSKLILIHNTFNLETMQPGDCIINFSMTKLIKHRNDINNMLHNRSVTEQPKPFQLFEEKEGGNEAEEKEGGNEAEQATAEGEHYKNCAAIIYGRLPPECRKAQAKTFNSNQLPYLVATNAIGMGLNLNIKKIVLMDYQKKQKDGKIGELEEHEIQQIAGRAGRGTETGYVQCANKRILSRVKRALSTVNETYGIQLQNLQDDTAEKESIQDKILQKRKKHRAPHLYNTLLGRQMTEKETQIKQACFYFDSKYVNEFHLILKNTIGIDMPVSEIISHLSLFAKLSDYYVLQQTEHIKYIFKLLQDSNLNVDDILMFYNGLSLSRPPYGNSKELFKKIEKVHRGFIKQFINERKVSLPNFIVQDYEDSYQEYQCMDQILQLQFYYTLLQSYVWLWGKYQFAFFQVKLATKIKKRLEEKINEILLDNKFMKDSPYCKSKPSKEGQINNSLYPSFEESRVTWKKKVFQCQNTLKRPKFISEMIKKAGKAGQGGQGADKHLQTADSKVERIGKDSKSAGFKEGRTDICV